MNARISHLDEILKEKSSNLQLFGVTGSPGDDKNGKEKESLRYEIRNLRRTRDTLLDQRVSLCKKLKRDKMLTYKEERKMLECDEAIMVRKYRSLHVLRHLSNNKPNFIFRQLMMLLKSKTSLFVGTNLLTLMKDWNVKKASSC